MHKTRLKRKALSQLTPNRCCLRGVPANFCKLNTAFTTRLTEVAISGFLKAGKNNDRRTWEKRTEGRNGSRILQKLDVITTADWTLTNVNKIDF